MGISINLYKTAKAEKFEDLKDIEKQIADAASNRVNLYKTTSELALIFSNTTDPFTNPDVIPHKMLFGIQAYENVGVGEIGGFLPSSEIAEITKWISNHKIETFEGFTEMYDSLSIEVKTELEDWGIDASQKKSLFDDYVSPLVIFYFAALANQNSVVFIGQ